MMTNEDMRVLYKIDGSLERLVASVEELRAEFKQHVEADATSFSAARLLIYQERDTMGARVGKLENGQEYAKGAGKVILTIFLGMATFIGGVVLAALEGWIKLKL